MFNSKKLAINIRFLKSLLLRMVNYQAELWKIPKTVSIHLFRWCFQPISTLYKPVDQHSSDIIPRCVQHCCRRSIRVLIAAMIGRESGGGLNKERMSISPIILELGMAPVTAARSKRDLAL
jgi:hypothetical protein